MLSLNEITERFLYYENNREILLENRERIRKQISKCIMEQGFKRKGRSTFVKISEDIAAFFTVEHPSNSFYTWFCVFPLFMPPLDHLVLNYGDRLSSLFHDNDMNISDYANEAETDLWYTRTTAFIRNEALPFIERVNTAEKMIRCLEAAEKHPRNDVYQILRGMHYEIKQYAELSLHHNDRAIEAARQVLAKYDDPPYGEDARVKARAEYMEFYNLAASGNNQAVDDMLNNWREKNLEFFTKKK